MSCYRKCKLAVSFQLIQILAIACSLLFPSPSWAFTGLAGARDKQETIQTSPQDSYYETRAQHDPDGIGKFYLGREIAQVMGPGGIEWLDRSQRETEEHPAQVLDALHLHPGQVVADLGAGSGYFTFRMTPLVGPTGKVFAVDVQEEMIRTVRQRAAALKLTNVDVIRGTATNPNLPSNSVDLVLMVDVYHELSYPREIMENLRKALKPGGQVVFVEYRKEDPSVPIKELHKLSLQQLDKEMKAVGFGRVRVVESLPLQHIAFFKKEDGARGNRYLLRSRVLMAGRFSVITR